MKRSIKSLPMSMAVAVLVSVAAAGCATAAGGPSLTSAPGAQAGFAGYKWRVVTIDHAGKEAPVPARSGVYLQFAPDGQFGAREPVNYHGGTYHQAGGGFTTSGMVSTAVGYAGHDPVVLLSVGAISAFDSGAHAEVRLTGDRLAVTVGGYLLTCQRDGRQADFPPARPT
jgi:heat shock protein HslJ